MTRGASIPGCARAKVRERVVISAAVFPLKFRDPDFQLSNRVFELGELGHVGVVFPFRDQLELLEKALEGRFHPVEERLRGQVTKGIPKVGEQRFQRIGCGVVHRGLEVF
jgi:hypothetical protein